MRADLDCDLASHRNATKENEREIERGREGGRVCVREREREK